MSSWGPWEPEAADLLAKVLTNGFETCLLRPRDQPLAEGKFPAWLSVLVASSLLPCSLLPLQSWAVALGAVAWREVTWGGLSVTASLWQPPQRRCVLGPRDWPCPPLYPPSLPCPLLPVPLPLPHPAGPHTWLWAVPLPPGLAALPLPPQRKCLEASVASFLC